MRGIPFSGALRGNRSKRQQQKTKNKNGGKLTSGKATENRKNRKTNGENMKSVEPKKISGDGSKSLL